MRGHRDIRVHPCQSVAKDQSAFTRTELVVVLAVIALISVGAVLPWLAASQRQARETECQLNMRRIGGAFHQYAADHDDRIPYALVVYDKNRRFSWDFTLRYYLSDGLLGTNTPVTLDSRTRERALAGGYACPADTIKRTGANRKRSYAMPAHNMNRKNWPPGSDNATGIGLTLSFGPDGTRIPPEWKYNHDNTNDLASFHLSKIPSPKDTLLLTEKAETNNIVYWGGGATLRTTAEHLNTNLLSAEEYHQVRFNYLMVDGHVEALLPGQTVGPLGEAGTNVGKHFGIWTVKQDD